MNEIKAENKQHSQAFDCFRAIAALSVVTGHFATSQKEIPLWLKYILQIPINYGVPVFFLISGYLLAASFRSAQKTNQNLSYVYPSFLKKRVYRIYPAYLTAILFLFAVYRFDIIDVLVHVFNIHTFWQNYTRSINPVFWSLGVEFQWYIIAPLLIMATLSKNRIVCFITVALSITMSLILRNYAIINFVDQKFNIDKFVMVGNDQVIIHLYAFVLGIFMFRNRKICFNISWQYSLFCWLYLIAIAVLNYHWLTNIDVSSPLGLYALSNLQCLSQVILAILLFKYRHITIKQRFLSLCIYYIALVSYGLYIWHFPVLSFLESLNIPIIFRFVCYMAGSFIAASISYFSVERFFINRTKSPIKSIGGGTLLQMADKK